MKSSNLVNKEKEELIQQKLQSLCKNIKSKYILVKIFTNLDKKRKLNIIKYNKKVQDRLDISVIDFQEFSSIELKIKLAKDKYGTFINIKKEEQNYYHIYFNYNKEEIKKTSINKGETIEVIKILIDYQIQSLKELFFCCDSIESIYYKNIYRKNINDMSGMFSNCSSLKELNLDNFNTSNVKDMSFMFSGCSSLKTLNLNNFNTINVTDMSYMFYKCSKFNGLNLNNFNTMNVEKFL